MADLIAAFCIRAATDRVLDPSCGAGDFLQRASRRLARLGGGVPSLTGVEIDPGLAEAARARLPEAEIVTADFLALTASGAVAVAPARRTPGPAVGPPPGWPAAPFDAVVGNPPYVRHELLPAARKRELAALSAAPGRPRLGGRCDLHGWFWAPALACLRHGGRLGWVVSSTWLDAAYGAGLREWLAAEVTVVAVIESEVESWFDEARVRTVVVILERSAQGARAAARFIRLGRRLDEIAPHSLDEAARAQRLADLAAHLESGGRVRPARETAAVRRVPRKRLATEPWGAALRATDLCHELIERAADRLVPLEDVATVRWGIKTGDDAVFFPSAQAAASASLEDAVLRPAVFSLMELDRLVVSERRLARRLLMVDTRDPAHRALLDRPDSGLSVWLARAQADRATHRRPTVGSREQPRSARRWFELRPGPPGAILWSIMHQYRHLAPLNPHGVPANDNLLLVDPRPGVDARLLAALLNSHVQALLKHAAGRQRNEGMLKTQAVDVRRMRVPDPRRLSPQEARRIVQLFEILASRRIGTVSQEGTRPDRRHLDEAVLGALGLPARERPVMAARLAEDLQAQHARDRRWESDAVARRRRRVRPAACVR